MDKPKVDIVYRDSEVVVINKPSGVSVTRDRVGAPRLNNLLAEQYPSFGSRVQRVHRLDKDTSGVMIMTLDNITQMRYSDFFRQRSMKKVYLTLVSGPVKDKKGYIDSCIDKDRNTIGKMKASYEQGKESFTEWQLLADFGTIALLMAKPMTGRTHQIRVHLKSVGLPLLIDRLYSSKRSLYLSDFKLDYNLAKDQTEKPLIDRLTLHAYQIETPLVKEDRPTKFVAKLDKQFLTAIKMLTKYNPKGKDAFLNPKNYDLILKAQPIQ